MAEIEIICALSGPKLGDTEAFGVTASVVFGGILCVAGVAVCCYLLPELWKYKSENLTTEAGVKNGIELPEGNY